MKLALFVHDFYKSIGHSNALLESLDHLPPDLIHELYLVGFESDDPDKLLPSLKCKKTFIKVPGKRIRPMLLKTMFYHLYSWFVQKFMLPKKCILMSIGCATLNAHIVNIQFIQKQWVDLFFEMGKLSGLPRIYKTLLFRYYLWNESHLFKPHRTFLILSRFVRDYLISDYKIPSKNALLCYSGVNTKRFEIKNISREELLKDLSTRYPELKRIDLQKPIALFVGALERKGIHFVLEAMKKASHCQLLVVGKSSAAEPLDLNKEGHIHVFHTREIEKFYQLADAFVFPSLYEPFGLVLTEAASMGLSIFSLQDNIGANELLVGLPEVYLFQNPQDLDLSSVRSFSLDEKKQLRLERLKKLDQYGWREAAKVVEESLHKVTKEVLG